MNTLKYILIGLITIFIFTACHSKYIEIKSVNSWTYAWNDDDSAFAFTTIIKAFKRPTGISTFPDGGRTETVYYDVAGYYYDLKTKKLHRIIEFNDLLPLYGKDRFYLSAKMAYQDSIIYFKLDNVSDYDIKSAKSLAVNRDKLDKFPSMIAKISKIYVYDIKSKKRSMIDALPLHVKWAERHKSYNHLKPLRVQSFENISCSQWGINFQKKFGQSHQTSLEYIVDHAGGKMSRRCIIEQIFPTLNKNEVEQLLKDMNERKSELYTQFKNNSDGPYQESLKRDRYNSYVEYLEKIKKQLK